MVRETRLITPVKGLICPRCEDEVAAALMERKGILFVTPSYIKAKIDILYDPDIISEGEIKAFLDASGYPACDRAKSGIIYDALTLFSTVLVILLLKVITLPSIPSLSTVGEGMFYLTVFLIGLVTGTHCTVMCGGIMLSGAEKTDNTRGRFINITFYNLSRVISSAVLGFIFSSFGCVLSFSDKAKSMIYVSVGLYVIFKAFALWGFPIIREIENAFPHLCPFKNRGGESGPVILGIMTALMPCSASGAMWMTAVTLPSGLEGALMMALWALGTVPMMMLFGMLSKKEKGKYYGVGIRVNIVLLLSLGLRLFLMGL